MFARHAGRQWTSLAWACIGVVTSTASRSSRFEHPLVVLRAARVAFGLLGALLLHDAAAAGRLRRDVCRRGGHGSAPALRASPQQICAPSPDAMTPSRSGLGSACPTAWRTSPPPPLPRLRAQELPPPDSATPSCASLPGGPTTSWSPPTILALPLAHARPPRENCILEQHMQFLSAPLQRQPCNAVILRPRLGRRPSLDTWSAAPSRARAAAGELHSCSTMQSCSTRLRQRPANAIIGACGWHG